MKTEVAARIRMPTKASIDREFILLCLFTMCLSCDLNSPVEALFDDLFERQVEASLLGDRSEGTGRSKIVLNKGYMTLRRTMSIVATLYITVHVKEKY